MERYTVYDIVEFSAREGYLKYEELLHKEWITIE